MTDGDPEGKSSRFWRKNAEKLTRLAWSGWREEGLAPGPWREGSPAGQPPPRGRGSAAPPPGSGSGCPLGGSSLVNAKPVLRIHEIFVRIRGSIPLTNGSGSGSCYIRQ